MHSNVIEVCKIGVVPKMHLADYVPEHLNIMVLLFPYRKCPKLKKRDISRRLYFAMQIAVFVSTNRKHYLVKNSARHHHGNYSIERC